MEITKEKFDEVVLQILTSYSEQLLNDTDGRGACFTKVSRRDVALGRIDTLLWTELINFDEWLELHCKIMDVYFFHVNHVNPGLKAASATEEVTVIRRITTADISFRRPA